MEWHTAPGEVWTLATGGLAGWKFIGMGLGGSIGLLVSLLLLKLGWITRSFSDFEAWYQTHHAKTETVTAETGTIPVETIPNDVEIAPPVHTKQETQDSGVEDWLLYPHARREMIKELAFLCPPILLAFVGAWAMKLYVTQSYGPWTQVPGTGIEIAPVNAPLWLVVLGGVLMGYLIAGGVVWAVRIGGTLAFGKEAMGLGDVHMMAAVGACLGWIDPTIAFFLAAFVGVAYAIVATVFKGKLNRAMPYGPFLAIATMMVLLGKPVVELALGKLFGMQGPLNLP
jgi:hypothetical protein